MSSDIVLSVAVGIAMIGAIAFVLWRNYDRAVGGPQRRRLERARPAAAAAVTGDTECRVTGRVRADAPLITSPSGRACVYWWVSAQHWSHTSRQGAVQERWKENGTHSACVAFSLVDETGAVAVDARQAHALLQEIETPPRRLAELAGAEAAIFSQLGTGAENWTVRYLERIVVEGQLLTVLGTGRGSPPCLTTAPDQPLLLADAPHN